MRVHWLLPFSVSSISDINNSNLASVRLRAAAFAASCESNGVDISFGEFCSRIADVLVVGKIGADCLNARRDEAWSSIIRAHLSAGSRVYIDYTDNHIGFASPMSGFYSQLSKNKSVNWIVPSEWLRSFLVRLIPEDTDCFIINDAIEVPVIKPDLKRASSTPFKFLWFGHSSNYEYLQAYLQCADWNEGTEIELFVLSNVNLIESAQTLARLPLIKSVHVGPWSLSALLELSKTADLVLIPGNPYDPRKAGVGCNRLATSLAIGLPVFATPYSSYVQFESFFEPLRRDFLLSLDSDLLLRMKQRLAEFQDSLLAPFALHSIGKEWSNLLLP